MVEPVGLLMWEHRLIEKIVPNIQEQIENINKTGQTDPNYIDTLVDFFKVYADKTHHGKEEDILFNQLKQKKIHPDHKRVMDELIQEHTTARNKIKQLIETNNAYRQGDKTQLAQITTLLRELAELYPKHIEKEDKHFFMPVMKYFTAEESKAMLQEFEEFDMAMIHWKYQKVIKTLTGEHVPIRVEP